MTTRAVQLLIVFGSASFVYVLFLLGVIPTTEIVQHEILPVLPFWLLVTFGPYSLGSLGWGLLTFNDKPEAYDKLLNVR